MKIFGYLLIGYVLLQAMKSKSAAAPMAPGDQLRIQSDAELAFWASADPGSVGTESINGVTSFVQLPDAVPGFSHDPSAGYT